jgi:hypothetical protein
MLLDRIERAIFDFVRDNGGFPPTHLLVDMQTFGELASPRSTYAGVIIDGATLTPKVFNVHILRVPNKYPFVAVARLVMLEGGS